MKFSAAAFLSAALAVSAAATNKGHGNNDNTKSIVDPKNGFPWERLNKNDSV